MRLRCDRCGCFVHAPNQTLVCTRLPNDYEWMLKAGNKVQPCKRCLDTVREPNTERAVVEMLKISWVFEPGLLSE